MKVALVVLVLVLAAAGAAVVAVVATSNGSTQQASSHPSTPSATNPSASHACTPGYTNGMRTFCGPARAKVNDGGKTYSFTEGGNCAIEGSTWTINIGTVTLSGMITHAYFGSTVFSKKAGTHSAAVTWQLPNGTSQSLRNGMVTLASNLKRGTFTGLANGRKSFGSFRCK